MKFLIAILLLCSQLQAKEWGDMPNYSIDDVISLFQKKKMVYYEVMLEFSRIASIVSKSSLTSCA